MGDLLRGFRELRRVCSHQALQLGVTPELAPAATAVCQHIHPSFKDLSEEGWREVLSGSTDEKLSRWSLHHLLSTEQWGEEVCEEALQLRIPRGDILDCAKVWELMCIFGDEHVGRRKSALVYSKYTSMLDIVQEALEDQGVDYVRLDESTPVDGRILKAEQFQDGVAPVFLLPLKAGGWGLTLTKAQVVVILDLDFNPQHARQAEESAHCLGQVQPVDVYYVVCRDTVEEEIMRRWRSKLQLDLEFGGAPVLQDEQQELTMHAACIEIAQQVLRANPKDEDNENFAAPKNADDLEEWLQTLLDYKRSLEVGDN